MEVLDRVYTTFRNLDRDFARSKKTRTEFITDKFGGDINIGSIIIMDAISSGDGVQTQEDIEKLSFIRDIFDKIKAFADNLDALEDFSFSDTSFAKELDTLLTQALVDGTHSAMVSPRDVWSAFSGALHFVATPGGAVWSPVQGIKVVHCYNETMRDYMNVAYPSGISYELGKYYAIKNRFNLRPITPERVTAALK